METGRIDPKDIDRVMKASKSSHDSQTERVKKDLAKILKQVDTFAEKEEKFEQDFKAEKERLNKKQQDKNRKDKAKTDDEKNKDGIHQGWVENVVDEYKKDIETANSTDHSYYQTKFIQHDKKTILQI